MAGGSLSLHLFPQVHLGLTQGGGETESIKKSLSSIDCALPYTA